MRRLWWLLLFVAFTAQAEFVNAPCDASKIEVYTANKPKLLFRWQACDKQYYCASADPALVNYIPVVQGWQPFIPYAIALSLSAPKLTDDENKICVQGIEPPAWTVAKNGTYTTRPLYDGALYEASQSWKQIGSVEVGAKCEPTAVRTVSTNEYHYVTNAKGLRGLSVCKVN